MDLKSQKNLTYPSVPTKDEYESKLVFDRLQRWWKGLLNVVKSSQANTWDDLNSLNTELANAANRLSVLEAVPTLHSVGGSRALDTVYHNTTGRNMIIMVALYSAIGKRVFYAKVGTSSPPSMQVGIFQPPLDGTVTSFSFLVPSESYYAIMRGSDSGTIYNWVEAY